MGRVRVGGYERVIGYVAERVMRAKPKARASSSHPKPARYAWGGCGGARKLSAVSELGYNCASVNLAKPTRKDTKSVIA